MKEVDIVSKIVNREGEAKASPSKGIQSINLSDYLLKSVWDKVFEIRTDSQGTEYIFVKLPMVTQYGITMYSGDGVDIPSLASGLPFDGRTIWYNPDTQQIEVIGGTGGGSGEGVSNFWDLSGIPSWITNSKPKYTYSEIEGTPDLTKYALVSQIPSLSGYATESWVTKQNYATKATTLSGYGITDAYTKTNVDDLLKSYVTLGGTPQTITGEKNFVGGLKVNGSPIYYDTEKKYWKLEGDLLVTGGVTMYGNEGTFTPSTIMDAIAVDGTTISKSGGVLKVIGGTGGGVADSVAWANITGKPTWIGSSKPTYSYSEITGAISTTELQNYLTQNSYLNVTSGDNKYLKLSGGTLTSSSVPLYIDRTDSNSFTLIGYRNTSKDLGYLGFSNYGDLVVSPNRQNGNTNYYVIWHEGNFTPSNYLPLSGGTINGAWALDIKRSDGNYSSLITFSNTSGILGYVGFTSDKRLAVWSDLNLSEYTIWHNGNDGSGSGLDADMLDGYHVTHFMSYIKGSGYVQANLLNSELWNVAGGEGYIEYYDNGTWFNSRWGRVSAHYGFDGDLRGNASSATKLQTARTIWGQSFDGTGNVDGIIKMTSADQINGTLGLSLNYDCGTKVGTNIWDGQGGITIRCTPSGNVGIGTASPYYKLDVNGTFGASSAVFNGENGIKITYDLIERTLSGSTLYMQYHHNGHINMCYGGGNVGIGTTSPSQKLHVQGAGYFNEFVTVNGNINCTALEISGAVPYIDFHYNNSSSDYTARIVQYSSGQLTLEATLVQTSSNFLASGGITMYSQRSLKNVIDERGLSLSELSTIKPTRYTWKDGRDNRLHFGGIADDIKQVLPEVVYSTSDGILTMDYGNAAFAVASSLIQPVVDHEKRIAMLEEENKQLRKEVERLKSA